MGWWGGGGAVMRGMLPRREKGAPQATRCGNAIHIEKVLPGCCMGCEGLCKLVTALCVRARVFVCLRACVRVCVMLCRFLRLWTARQAVVPKTFF